MSDQPKRTNDPIIEHLRTRLSGEKDLRKKIKAKFEDEFGNIYGAIQKFIRADTKKLSNVNLQKTLDLLGTTLEDIHVELSKKDQSLQKPLKLGFILHPLASPFIKMMADQSNFFKIELASFKKDNGFPALIPAKNSLKSLSIDYQKYKKNTKHNPTSRIYKEEELVDALRLEQLDLIALPNAYIETRHSQEIKPIAKIAFGTKGICVPCLIGPTKVIEKLEKKKDKLEENFTFQDLIKEVKYLEEIGKEERTINIIIIRDNISAILYEDTYSEKIKAMNQGSGPVNICYLRRDNGINLEQLLTALHNIAEGLDIEDEKIEASNFTIVQEKTKKALQNSKDFHIILFWNPQLAWLAQEINSYANGISAMLYELSDLFPETLNPFVSYNIYTRLQNITLERKEAIDNLFLSLGDLIAQFNDDISRCDKLESKEIKNRFPHLNEMANYLQMDISSYVDACLKLNFDLWYDKEWVSFLNRMFIKKEKV